MQVMRPNTLPLRQPRTTSSLSVLLESKFDNKLVVVVVDNEFLIERYEVDHDEGRTLDVDKPSHFKLCKWSVLTKPSMSE